MESRNGMKWAGLALCLSLAAGLSACSSMPSVPDWVDPTSWFGGDSSKSSDNDSGLSSAGQEAQNQDAAGQTPDLADVPQKPAPEDTAQASSTESSLASDRSRADYSADALRGGTEAAAPPPPASAPTDQQVAEVATTPSAAPASSDDDSSSSSSDQSASNASPAPAPAPSAPAPSDTSSAPAADTASSSSDQTPSMPGTLPDSGSTPAPQPAAAPAAPPPPAPAPVQMASNEPPPANTAPAPAQAMAAAPPPAPRTDAFGFAPSSAPPLDPSVGQFVAPGVVSHYQQTQMASIAPVYGYSTLSAGAVGTRAAVVKFSGDTTVLDAAGREEVEAAAEAFRARGGASYIRVVGHASSREQAVSPERHLQLDFDHSQARATAVAMALIKAGVPADKVLVEAVGDSAPVRAVGTGNDRSAEIFIQG